MAVEPAEYERYSGAALSPARLAAIWRGLPETERLGFVLALDESLCDLVMKLTMPARPAERETDERCNADCSGRGVD